MLTGRKPLTISRSVAAHAFSALVPRKGHVERPEPRGGEDTAMKVALIFTGSGPLVIVTSHGSLMDGPLLDKLRAKGIDKFIAYEIPLAIAEQRYGGHYQVVMRDLNESDDLRVLDFNGERAFRLFHWRELGTPLMYEAPTAQQAA
jgi:hypothetical protein